MNRRLGGLAAACAVSAVVVIAACATDPKPPIPLPADGTAGGFKSDPVSVFEIKDKKSGFLYASAETQEMEKDDFSNPAFLWLEQGEKLWPQAEGEAGKPCG